MATKMADKNVAADIAVIQERLVNHESLLESIADSIALQARTAERVAVMEERQTIFHKNIEERQIMSVKRTDEKLDALSKTQALQGVDVKESKAFVYKWVGAGTALSVVAVLIGIYASLGKILGQ